MRSLQAAAAVVVVAVVIIITITIACIVAAQPKTDAALASQGCASLVSAVALCARQLAEKSGAVRRRLAAIFHQ